MIAASLRVLVFFSCYPGRYVLMLASLIFQLAGLSPTIGDGHRDLTAARIPLDMSDIDKLLQVVIERGPFKTSEKRASLSAIHTPYSLNTDNAHNIGKKVLPSMVGHSVSHCPSIGSPKRIR